MDIQNKEINIRFSLIAGETIKLDINGVKEFEDVVSAGREARLTIKFQEVFPEE